MSIFILGIALLILVFALTYGLFYSIDKSLAGRGPYLSNETIGATHTPSPVTVMLSSVGMKFVGLFVMGCVASLIAGKGLQLIKSSRTDLVGEENDN